MPKENNREKALAALLESSSVTEAAQKCGLSQKTLYRFLEDDDFKREYRSARRQAFENSIAQIQSASGEAVETLRQNLHCENPFVEVRAAQIILDNAYKGIELLELMERIERLEDAIEENQKA